MIEEGKNPSTERKIKRARLIEKEAHTFSSIAYEWISHNKEYWSQKHLKRNEGLLKLYLLPNLGRLPIHEIEEHFLFTVLKPVYDSGRKESARRSRSIAAAVFSFAKDTHRCNSNPAKDLGENSYFKKPQVIHLAALSQSDVAPLLEELAKTGNHQRLKPQTVCALLVALYTGLRDHAIRGATWGEIDLAGGIWVVPGTRMKSGRKHLIPLPSQAIQALNRLKPMTFRGAESFVFTANTQAG